jgi:hypothetical protein
MTLLLATRVFWFTDTKPNCQAVLKQVSCKDREVTRKVVSLQNGPA